MLYIKIPVLLYAAKTVEGRQDGRRRFPVFGASSLNVGQTHNENPTELEFYMLIFMRWIFTNNTWNNLTITSISSSIRCASAWYADGRRLDPRVRQNILSLRFGHENKSTPILSLPLIQEDQLSVTVERMGTKYL